MKPSAIIILANGTNRDGDVAEAFSLAGAVTEIVPLNLLRTGVRHFDDYQIMVLPGGFSYADALGAGKLLAVDLQTYFIDELQKFIGSGKVVIGICNGFQALVKARILPGSPPLLSEAGDRGKDQTTLTINASGHFECRWVTLRPVSQTCIWTKGLEELITCPIAHGEGNFQYDNQAPSSDLIALTYVQGDGSPANGEYPANPNGSLLDIAGICNPTGTVLGIMPHPENHIHPWQHPLWARGVHSGSGMAIFRNGVKYMEAR